MGYKASMIIVEHPRPEIGDEQLLKELGFAHCAAIGTDYIENCMHPKDKSFGIGRFNGRLILTEDYQLTEKLERAKIPGALSDYEQTLSRLFPGSEILSVACHSVTNFAFHSLVKDGVKLRYRCVSGDYKAIEHGAPLKEEEPIYARSKMIDGVRMFRGEDDSSEYEYVEDQLMEDFTFEVAKRHLGVRIDTDEADQLNEVEFRKYRFDPRRAVIPAGTRTWEGELATYWMQDGVLVALPHDVERTARNVKAAIELVKEITGGKRVPVLMHRGAAVDATDDALKLSAEQFPLVYSAMAWIQQGAISRWFANRRYKSAAVPSRVFASGEEAMEWLRKAR